MKYACKTIIITLLFIAFLFQLSPAALATGPLPPFVASVDTMKESRDTENNQRTPTEISQTIQLISGLNVTHITVDTHYEYADYMRVWVNAIHASGKKVWFRGSFNQWENNNGTTGIMTPSQYIQQLDSFIRTNSDLFQPGDILDSCPELENGKYWNATYGSNWTWQPAAPNTATNELNQFLIDLTRTADTALMAKGISGVITQVHSTNSYFGKTPTALYPSTVNQFGVIAIDSYPEGTIIDPTTAAKSRTDELNAIYQVRNIPIIISEYGFSNEVPISDEVQRQVIRETLNEIAQLPYVVGLNYWVGPGSDTSGGYTYLLRRVNGLWQKRSAADILASFFDLKLQIACTADINQDKFVDLSDYSILVASFLKNPITNSRADITKDGIVDLSDYSALVTQFLKSCM